MENSSILASEWLSTTTDRGWVKAALEVHKKLKACHKDVKDWFCKPVPREVGDYHSIIFHATDLATIESRLKDNGFASPDDWVAAVRTVFRNAFVYNRPTDPTGVKVLSVAEAASMAFEKEMLRLRGVVML